MKVASAYNLFAAYAQAERLYAPETVRQMRDIFANWLGPFFGENEVADVTSAAVVEMRAAMQHRGLSVARQYAVIIWLKSLLRFCRDRLDVRSLDPAQVLLPKRP